MTNSKQQETFLLFSSPWQRLPFFHGLPTLLIHNLLQGAQLSQLKSKDVVFKQGESAEEFGFVVEGLVRLFRKNPKGHRIVMDFVGPGGMIGGLLMANPQMEYPVTAQFIGPGQFLRIPKATYAQFWMHEPEIIRRTQMANLERMQAIHSTRELQKYSLEEKIAQILLRMTPQDSATLDLQISRTDLADMVGANAASVIRIFSQWEKEGLIQKSAKGLETIAKEKLMEKMAS